LFSKVNDVEQNNHCCQFELVENFLFEPLIDFDRLNLP
jgi:hypothetical protein